MTASTQCPFCGGSGLPYWEKPGVARCCNCELLFRETPPSDEELSRLYEKSWSDPQANRAETGGADPGLARRCARKLVSSLGLPDFRRMKLLDFGAGSGLMLTALTELGAEVCGLDPFGYAFLEKKGFRAFRSLDEIPADLRFDGAVAIDVIEHLSIPWDTLSRIACVLKEAGWIYVSTPNRKSLNAKLSGPNWREANKKGHLFFFDATSLERTFKRAGYTHYRRLHWLLRYTNNRVRTCFYYALQASDLEGELRYLAFKNQS